MLESKVEAFLNRHSFKLENKKVIVGVSGGPDSLALLHYLLKEKEKGNLSIVVAHVDHMFRGEESYQDAMFVKSFCELHGVPFEMARIDVTKIMKATGKSSQIAAREVRYDFYLKMMEKYEHPYLALGHHGDDQMETILMRLTRGSTGKARAGIPFSRPFHHGTIFRPFLCVTKVELQDYCKQHQLTPRIDPSNEKGVYSRNRFRKQVLPFLKGENSHAHEQFQRFSEELQSDEAFLQELTVKRLNSVLAKKEEDHITIDIQGFLEMPLPLQRRGIQLILNYLYKEKPASLSAIHIDQVFFLIHHHEPSVKLDLPNGMKVIRSYLQLSFQFQQVTAEPYAYELHEPGMIKLPNGRSIRIDYIEGEIPAAKENIALFNADLIKWPIFIRTREKGDRMTVKGIQGTKKLKTIFIDQKVRVQDRDSWPVVTDKEGFIIWLPNLKKSSIEGIDYAAKQYIQLTYH
ncbi:tRNA lysidine(34) synthetase TilS [Neobacillus sp. MM2021_6]|uniref:tRNA lysidine(34) synthetase TilS n=1 Tax=Bacillaceae TaxID=186817 RepID=UPI00140C6E21|nr:MULTISPECIES: tRNA lysidine(34) synthetase TilS [Bacillaceae]MBO0961789.1 tRNA lysidine(34) synthetase TilS [Neobacillus sp. MM2021_6]NHC19921.1 tRNA lysidine(34) synthetase TilS [Bacillus sp. MM2020_4]